jgi:hypothetical protein
MKVTDWARAAGDRMRKRRELDEKQIAMAKLREVYDRPADEGERAAMRMALAVEHGEPWLRAVVDVGRQLQRGDLEVIAGRPGTAEAAEAGLRYSEMVRFEAVLLEAVEKARKAATDNADGADGDG